MHILKAILAFAGVVVGTLLAVVAVLRWIDRAAVEDARKRREGVEP